MTFVDRLAAAPRTFFYVTAEPFVLRYKREDKTKYTLYERNLANFITIFRIIAGLVVSVFLVTAYDSPWRSFWFICTLLVLMSDGWDGAVARILGIESTLGKALDPIADKLLLTGLSVSLVCNFTQEFGHLPKLFFTTVMGALFFELSLMITGTRVGLEARKLHILPNGANSYGKVKFGIQCLAMLLGWTIPNRVLACAIATGLLILAMPFSLLSNRGYRRELWRMQQIENQE